jgi:hypothetical protein
VDTKGLHDFVVSECSNANVVTLIKRLLTYLKYFWKDIAALFYWEPDITGIGNKV